MIKGTNASEPKISEKTKKIYYVIMDDSNPVGVCSSIVSARVCADEIAQEKSAGKVEGMDAYIYEDSSGSHSITIRCVRRMKFSR